MSAAAEAAGAQQQQQSAYEQMQQWIATVMTKVNDQLQAFQTSLYSDLRSAAQTVADRVDLIKDAMSNQCDDDGSDDVSQLQLPMHEAQLLDTLRAGSPDIYAVLLQYGEQLNDADIFSAKQVVLDAIQKLVAPQKVS